MKSIPEEADREASREYWVEVVRGAADKGRLDQIPTHLAGSVREKAQARKQNYWITRKSYGGFHDNYERIHWNG